MAFRAFQSLCKNTIAWFAPALVGVVCACVGCDTARSGHQDGADSKVRRIPTLQSSDTTTRRRLERQINEATAQGVLRVASLPEASIVISVEPEPGQTKWCLSMMATDVLAKAGFTATPSWNPEIEGQQIHVFASADFLEGKTTLALQGYIGFHIGGAPDIYEASLITGRRNPTLEEVETLVARVIGTPAFQRYAATVDPDRGGGVVAGRRTSDEVKSACK